MNGINTTTSLSGLILHLQGRWEKENYSWKLSSFFSYTATLFMFLDSRLHLLWKCFRVFHLDFLFSFFFMLVLKQSLLESFNLVCSHEYTYVWWPVIFGYLFFVCLFFVVFFFLFLVFWSCKDENRQYWWNVNSFDRTPLNFGFLKVCAYLTNIMCLRAVFDLFTYWFCFWIPNHPSLSCK